MRYSGVDYLKPLTPYLALLATPVTFRPEMVVSPSPRLWRPCTGHSPEGPIVTGISRAGKLQLSCKTQDHTLATKDLGGAARRKQQMTVLIIAACPPFSSMVRAVAMLSLWPGRRQEVKPRPDVC